MTQKESKSHSKDVKKSLLRSGLTSEFYLLSFVKPDKPYEIAKTIKNVPTIPDASKVYPARNRLVDEGYLRKEGEKCYPEYPRLAQEIAEVLHQEKKITLDDKEIELLTYFLKNSKFTRLLHDDVATMIQSQDKGIRNIDSLKYISSLVGSMGLFLWSVKQDMSNFEESKQFNEISDQITTKDFEKMESQWEQFSDILMNLFGDLFASKFTIRNVDGSDTLDGIDKKEFVTVIFSSIPIFFAMIDSEFLKKIASLVDGKDAMNIVEMILSKRN